MIKDATDVDLTTAITGAIRISTVFDQYANTARKIHKNIAKRNPVTIRTKLNPTDCQKFPVKLSSKAFGQQKQEMPEGSPVPDTYLQTARL